MAQLDVFRPIIKLLVQQIHDVLMASSPGPDEPYQVLVMIDEFRQLGKMESIVSKLAINAGYGFRMVLILQDLAQLDEVYGKATRQTTVTACQVKLFIRMNDVETSEHVSEMLGPTTIEVPTPIIRAGQGIFGGRDKSLSYQERPFRTAAELRQMPANQAVVLGSSPPGFMVRKVTYYKDAPYKATYQQFRHRRLKVPPLSRWQDLPLRSMAEVEAAANNAPAAPFELGEPDTVEAPVSSDAAYADAAPPATGAAAGRAGPVGLPKVKSDSADAPQALPSSGLPTGGEAKAKSEVAAEVPQLKPKRTDQTADDAPRPLPTLGRRSAPAASKASDPSASEGKASILQFQVRPGNKSTSIAALLASLDQEVEAGARSLLPSVDSGDVDGVPSAALEALQDQIRRHGDR
ncbi:type IV secretion system protein [Mesorhizobium amorphae CCNWGS0123]|uniref:Type IV secretion system protein n=1 Tax=Mesorhizobium amorphae CCNWGS0123 TaxID=1082933 RepID=G6YIK3_9HYPH|nr:type IV secretion system protein [Mesorhizobium amorphae CCNWGS0123]